MELTKLVVSFTELSDEDSCLCITGKLEDKGGALAIVHQYLAVYTLVTYTYNIQ